jgi:signal transduction histidine kinase
LRTLRNFGTYAAVLGVCFGLAALLVHALLAREYRNAVQMRLTILANSGAEAVENRRAGESVDDVLAKIVGSTDEGLIWFDSHGNRAGSGGHTTGPGALSKTIAIHEDGIEGSIEAVIARSRVATALRDLDFDLAIGTAVVMIVGGIVFSVISRQMNAQLQTAYRTARQFTADVAHELRTPLAVIMANAEALEPGPAGGGYDERGVVNIRRAGRQMRALMDDLLILARADEDVTLDLHAIDIPACVGAVLAAYDGEASVRQVHLTLHVTARQTVYGRPEQVARIVANLIENALRYTQPGGAVDVTCRSGRSVAFVEVRDTGIGISSEHLERVFERFWRAPGSRAVEGSGLGLSIARSLARAHGGDITVVSPSGRGSTFALRLPLLPPRNGRVSTSS